MTMTDPIADMLTRVRNANVAMHDTVRMPSSKVKEALAAILLREGYIEGSSVQDDPGRPGRTLEIRMKYSPERKRTISGLRRVSKPGCGCTPEPTSCPASSEDSAWPCCRQAMAS
jgi:small subunit ribosomal protein S8